ncbi:GTPase [Rhizohabitans arisaemae]|uniref:GTPase n=1 Tax=Rhizohabitans arisaemae TaxID=2720610 RepID=UPI0024B19196|nr:GTPase [Rhizohabitans arisaemae]
MGEQTLTFTAISAGTPDPRESAAARVEDDDPPTGEIDLPGDLAGDTVYSDFGAFEDSEDDDLAASGDDPAGSRDLDDPIDLDDPVALGDLDDLDLEDDQDDRVDLDDLAGDDVGKSDRDSGKIDAFDFGVGARPEREPRVPDPIAKQVEAALSTLRELIGGIRLGLELPGVEKARKSRQEILAQLDDYVVPRLTFSTAPALVVVAGSTGAGKSTLVNTLAGAKVSATGVRRPTTSVPVLVFHPSDRAWFQEGGVLPDLVATAGAPEQAQIVLTETERLPEGVAVLDTPDIDSVVEENHAVAHRLLAAADLWVFVTTAARYADAPAWRLLRLAKERGARLAIVLSRVPGRSKDVVVAHFTRMLEDYGLGDVERFVIPECAVTDGRLPSAEVTELRMWLAELSVDEESRDRAVQQTLSGVLDSFRTRIPELARHLEAQVAFRAEMRADVEAAYGTALAEIDEAMRSGSLLRGEILARWQDFSGTGELIRSLHVGRSRRLRAPGSKHQEPARAGTLKAAIRSGLEAVIIAAAHRASEEVVVRWGYRAPAGTALAATPGLGRASEELIRRATRAIGAWQEHVLELIRTHGVAKRSVARVVSFDEEALAMVFTVGLLGYGTSDVRIETGTSVMPQRLLRALFGAEYLRNMSAKARNDLRARVSMLFDEEMIRYADALDHAGIPDENAATHLYQATYNLEVAR